MAIIYDFYEMPNAKHYARPVNTELYTTGDIAKAIARASSLTEGDVRSALSSLSSILEQGLMNGWRIHLEGIGYFSTALQCESGDGTKEPNPHSVKFKKVKFLADNDLKKKISHVKITRVSQKVHSANYTPEEIDAKLMEYFQTHEHITRKGFRSLFDYTPSTAIRRINTLLEAGKLVKESMRFSAYKPAPGWYGRQ